MRKLLIKEDGYTLTELLVTIVLLGILLPSIFSLVGLTAMHSSRHVIWDRAVLLAEEKLEEIIGKKDAQWDWYKNPDQFAVNENLIDDFHRTVTVTSISNWGAFAINGWEVQVEISHPQLPKGYSVVVRLTKYHEDQNNSSSDDENDENED